MVPGIRVVIAVFEAFFVRYFLIEYVGDVAAYISPYKDSKFDALRHAIQNIGFNVGRVIYGFDVSEGDSKLSPYVKVLMVGHSLGSVLAYDTLNAMINLDNVSGSSKRVVEKTRALITFGSPLDKTAFLFRVQATNPEHWIREQLAASMQPLIVSYDLYRPETFKWANIWSPQDIISGELNYYDDPGLPPQDLRRIHNMVDPEANTPLKAHVQYWSNRMLRQQLYHYIVS